MSQTRVRLRALASLGLSTILFGALAPATAAVELGTAGQVAPAAPAAMIATAPAEIATQPTNFSMSSMPATTLPGAPNVVLGTASIVLGAVRRRSDDAADTGTTPTSASFVAPATVAASSRIIALAETHLGARYEHGATGPRAFDCSGLVYRVFEDAGLGRLIDGLRSADALYVHFRARHMTSTVNPQPGDLVIFGGGSHVGIYVGAGRVLNAMISGVAITRISAVYPKFTTYVHLGLTKLRLPAPPTARTAQPVSSAKVLETVATIAPLSLRSTASTASRRLAVLRGGTRLSVIRISRDRRGVRWFEVVVDGRTGWVAARYTR